jgi:YihY family inner membrane protein
MSPDAGPAPSVAAERPVRGVRRLLAATTIAVPSFFRHHGTQLAAAISYRVLFSLVPFLALALSLLDLVLNSETEMRIDEWLAGLAPGDDELEKSIARTLANTGTLASITGFVAFVGLLWTASGMAASIRIALGVVWDDEQGRPFLRGKLVDLGLVFLGVAVVLAAFVANVAMQLLTTYGSEVADWLGLERVDVSVLGALTQSLAALAVTIAALLVLYRLAPTAPSVRELLPGAIVGGLGAHLAIVGFSAYIALMSGFDVYGALGSIFGFLFLVYLVASAIVVGAEVVAAWPLAARPKVATEPPQPLLRRVLGAARGLVSGAPRS